MRICSNPLLFQYLSSAVDTVCAHCCVGNTPIHSGRVSSAQQGVVPTLPVKRRLLGVLRRVPYVCTSNGRELSSRGDVSLYGHVTLEGLGSKRRYFVFSKVVVSEESSTDVPASDPNSNRQVSPVTILLPTDHGIRGPYSK